MKKFVLKKDGFTLIEAITAFAIIAVISLVFVASFQTATVLKHRDITSRNNAVEAEREIAYHETPTSQAHINLKLGNYSIAGSADSYTVGGKTYTVIRKGAEG
ncbi:MAG: prepilin-type N-terminal cleavage/methylation domain-containing protein [Clostridiales Family XIII bacterium]|jgi:Tfp pilus assembly protein PilE|nr:prepilin-type N-terminal cleavage/methylation domain-containing protein [Clostridiales Family XIII bacterium]